MAAAAAIVGRHLQIRDGTVRHQRMELKMPKTPPEREHELGQRVRMGALPDPEADLDASVTQPDRQRSTSHAPQPSHDAGLAVVLWLFALLLAEIEFWMSAFAHMYRT
jgi:hypothetical protein